MAIALSIAAVVLICSICVCCLDNDSDSSEFYDRSRIHNNLCSVQFLQEFTEEGDGEDKMQVSLQNMNPGQATARAKYDLIKEKVIEKRVVDSTHASNRKSNINISRSELAQLKGPSVRLPSPQSFDAPSDDAASNDDIDSPTATPSKVSFGGGFDLEKQKSISLPEKRKSNIQIQGGRGSLRSTINHGIISMNCKLSNISRQQSMERYTEKKCFICLKSYKVGDTIYWSPNDECTHSFHSKCMMRWLLKNNECPLCQNDFLLDSADTAELP